MSGFADLLSQLRAAGEATRLRALYLLREGELTVTELTDILDQSQPRVSRHLKVLADAGLVERFQEGAWVFYRLAPPSARGPLAELMAEEARGPLQEDLTAFRKIRARRAEAAAAYFAQHAEQWEALRALHIADEAVEAAMLNFVEEPVQQFLDLGTGTGRMLTVFADHYQHGVGLDLSPEMLALARVRVLEDGLVHAQVRRSDFMTEELPQNIDLICLHHVLHFLTAPEEAIAAAAAALSPSGRILIADFAPHDREDLRETHAHRRLGFADDEVAGWAHRHGLVIVGQRRLDPPREGGLVTRVWCLGSHITTPQSKISSELGVSHVQG